MPAPHAALVGATGLVGGHCLQRLLVGDYYEAIVTLGRRPLTLQSIRHHHHVVDFTEAPRLREHLAVRDLFACLGTTMKKAGSRQAFREVDFEYSLRVATAAREAGVEQLLVVSSLGADPSSAVFYSRVKGELEEALSGLGFVALHVFRPSLLLGERTETRAAEGIGRTLSPVFSPLMVGPLKRYRPIHAKTVARAMVSVAQRRQTGVHVYESDQIEELAARA